MKTHPPTPSNLIVVLNHVESMPSDTIKIRESVNALAGLLHLRLACPTACGAQLVWSDHMKKKIQIHFGSTTTTPQTPVCGARKDVLDDPCPVHKKLPYSASPHGLRRNMSQLHY
jgi:hypothetical protein